MLLVKKKLLVYLFVLFAGSVKAGLIGADLYYKHIDDREYKIILVHYLDCASEKSDSIQTCFILTKESGGFYRKINLSRSSERDTNISLGVVCAGNKDNCVKKVVYASNIALPTMHGGYEIVWKSKNKFPLLKNVTLDPAQNFMLTAFVPQLAKDNYNSSTEIISFPFKSICLNKMLNYQLRVVEAEKDSVVYSLSLPYVYKGGVSPHANQVGLPQNPANPGYAQDQNLPVPPEENPVLPLTRMELNISYTASNPVHAGELSIDAKSGLIKIKPEESGKYMICFLATEYRKGNIMSEHQVIYFFNVEN